MGITIQYQVDRAQWKRVVAYVARLQLRTVRLLGTVFVVLGLALTVPFIVLGGMSTPLPQASW